MQQSGLEISQHVQTAKEGNVEVCSTFVHSVLGTVKVVVCM